MTNGMGGPERGGSGTERPLPSSVSIIGPSPVGAIGIKLIPGVTALYGLNGAGKTSILTGIGAAFSGLRADRGGTQTLHFDIPATALDEEVPPSSDDDQAPPVHHAITRAIWRASNDLFGSAYPSAMQSSLRGAARVYLEQFLDRSGQAVENLVADGKFSLEATGVGHPQWEVVIGMARKDPKSERPILERSQALGKMMDGFSWSSALSRHPQSVVKSFADRLRSTLSVDMPPFVPVPLFPMGFIEGSDREAVPLLVDDRFLAEEVNQHTANLVFSGVGVPVLVATAEDNVDIAPERVELIEALNQRVGELSGVLLQDAPYIGYVTTNPQYWAQEPPGIWTAVDLSSGTEVALTALSRAESRWSSFAAAMAVTETMIQTSGDVLGAVVFDEPEEALHALAERHLVSGLKRLADELSAPIIAATHSREFLNDPEIRLIRVWRTAEGKTACSEMTPEMRQSVDVDALGLEPSDLLQSYRVFLLVEGAHDQAVLEGLFAAALEESRVKILPFRGVINAVSVADAAVLFDFTPAELVVLVDHVRVAELPEDWKRAQDAAKTSPDKAVRHLKRLEDAGHKDRGTEEARVLHDLAVRAIKRGRADRLHLAALGEADIVRYLPAEYFVAGATWKELEKEHRKSESALAFKEWMDQVKGAPITTETVRRAAETLDAAPAELVALVERCQAISRTFRMRV